MVIPAFQALSRLVLFHGSLCLERLRCVYFFFIFKSVFVATFQFLYGCLTGASESIAASSLFLLFFNSMITSPITIEVGMFRTRSIVKSVYEAIAIGMAYGLATFFIVRRAVINMDIVDSSGRNAGHPVVSRVFSSCIYIAALTHFVFV